jgi:small subunit ribosomal protein S2
MKDLPGVIFIIDTRKEAIAVAEASRLDIPIVAVVDTNCNPDGITYPIPGNDDAIRSITLFTQIIANAVVDADNEAGLKIIENLQEEEGVEEAAAEPAAVPKEDEQELDVDFSTYTPDEKKKDDEPVAPEPELPLVDEERLYGDK